MADPAAFDRPELGALWTGRRDLWALYGVTGDELSTTVLVAGFAASGSGAFATPLRIWGFRLIALHSGLFSLKVR
jgi:hypothetical protein